MIRRWTQCKKFTSSQRINERSILILSTHLSSVSQVVCSFGILWLQFLFVFPATLALKISRKSHPLFIQSLQLYNVNRIYYESLYYIQSDSKSLCTYKNNKCWMLEVATHISHIYHLQRVYAHWLFNHFPLPTIILTGAQGLRITLYNFPLLSYLPQIRMFTSALFCQTLSISSLLYYEKTTQLP